MSYPVQDAQAVSVKDNAERIRDAFFMERHIRHYEELMRAYGLYRPYDKTLKVLESIPTNQSMAKFLEARGSANDETTISAAKACNSILSLPFIDDSEIKAMEEWKNVLSKSFSQAECEAALKSTDFQTAMQKVWDAYKKVYAPFVAPNSSDSDVAKAHMYIIASVDYSHATSYYSVDGQDRPMFPICLCLEHIFRSAPAIPLCGHLSAYIYNFKNPEFREAELKKGGWVEFSGPSESDMPGMYSFQRPMFCKARDGNRDAADATYKQHYNTSQFVNSNTQQAHDDGVVWLYNDERQLFGQWANYELGDMQQILSFSDDNGNRRSALTYFKSVIHPYLVRLTASIAYLSFFKYNDCISMAWINQSSNSPKDDLKDGCPSLGFPRLNLSITGRVSHLYASKYAMRLVKRNCLGSRSPKELLSTRKLFNGDYNANDRYIMVRDVDCLSSMRYIPVPLHTAVAVPAELRNQKWPTLLNMENYMRDSTLLLNSCLLIRDGDDNCFDNIRRNILKTIGSNDLYNFSFTLADFGMGKGWDEQMQRDMGPNGEFHGLHTSNYNKMVNKLVVYFLVRLVENWLHLAMFCYPGINGMKNVLAKFYELCDDEQLCNAVHSACLNMSGNTVEFTGNSNAALPMRFELNGWRTSNPISLVQLIRDVKPLFSDDKCGFHVILPDNKIAEMQALVRQTRAGAFMADTDGNCFPVISILRNAAAIYHLINLVVVYQNKSDKTFADKKEVVAEVKNDQNRVYTWKSLKDSLFAVYLFNVFHGTCSNISQDADFGADEREKNMLEVVSQLGLDSHFNHPALDLLKDDKLEFMQNLAKLFYAS